MYISILLYAYMYILKYLHVYMYVCCIHTYKFEIVR